MSNTQENNAVLLERDDEGRTTSVCTDCGQAFYASHTCPMRVLVGVVEEGLSKERVPGASLGQLGTSRLPLRIRASTASKDCLRAIWLEAAGYPPSKTPISSDVVLETGNAWHDILRGILKKNGSFRLLHEEAELKDSFGGVELTGHIDGILEFGGRRHILEIKTASNYGFKNARAEIFSINSYSRQAAIYCYLWNKNHPESPVEGTVFLFLNKDPRGVPVGAEALSHDLAELNDGVVDCFVRRFSEDETRLALDRIVAVAANEIVPNALPPKETVTIEVREGKDRRKVLADILPWQCSYCSFSSPCLGEDVSPFLYRRGPKGNWLTKDTDKRGPYDKWVLARIKNEGETQ